MAFEAYRRIVRDTGQNRASFAADFASAAQADIGVLWAAVRAGWREGYSLSLTGIPAQASSHEPLERLGAFTRFSVEASDLATASAVYDHLRRFKLRGFDFELDFRGGPLTAEALGECLSAWRAAGRPVQSIVPPDGAHFEALAATARQHNVLLTLEGAISLKLHGRGHRWLPAPSIEQMVELARD